MLIGGTPANFLLGPIMWLLFFASFFISTNAIFTPPSTLLFMARANLIVGNAIVIIINMIGLFPRKNYNLIPYVLFSPVYWMLQSAAAYKGLWQLMTKPYYWEKTKHGISKQALVSRTVSIPDDITEMVVVKNGNDILNEMQKAGKKQMVLDELVKMPLNIVQKYLQKYSDKVGIPVTSRIVYEYNNTEPIFELPLSDLTETEIESLFEMIDKCNTLTDRQKVEIIGGLSKLLKGSFPEETILDNMEKVFSEEFIKIIRDKREEVRKIYNGISIGEIERKQKESKDIGKFEHRN